MDDRVAALEEAVRRFGEAWAIGDTATLDPLLSPSYTHSDGYGKLHDRAAWLGYASQRKGRATQIEFRDIRIRVHGDVGIVTGINDLRGPGIRNAADQKNDTLAFTQVWIWQQGRWLREAFQATPVNVANAG